MIVTGWVVVVKVVQCDFETDSEEDGEILISSAINPPRDILEGVTYSIYDSKSDATVVAESLASR